MTRVIASCLFVGLVAGCGGAPTAVGTSNGSATPAAATVKDCGSFRQVDPRDPQIPETGLACFSSALAAHQLARLVATALTTEGDPITDTYEARSDGQVHVTTDYRRDRFAGGRTSTVQICTGPKPSKGELMFAQCTEEEPARGIPGTSTRP